MPKFISPYKGLNLTMKPATKSVVDGRVYTDSGKHLEFKGGEYTTEDKKEIDFIRNHSRFGVSVFEDKPENIKVVKTPETKEESAPAEKPPKK